MRYSTLLMDADDTIFDFPRCEYIALRNTLTAWGLDFDDRIYSCFTTINSGLWRLFEANRIKRSELRVRRFSELMDECFSGSGDPARLADTYVERLAEQAIFIDGAEDALRELSQVYRIYLITNGLKPVQENRIALSGLDRFISGAFISDAMNAQKPMKEYFDAVLDAVPEKDTTRLLVVGDSLTSDMQGGRNAGLDTCLYDPKDRISMPHPLCDYKIHSLTELLRNDEYA